MALLDIFKKKKKPAELPAAGPPVGYPVPMGMPVPGPMPPSAPVEQVISMQQQGMTNNQIIASLQQQGYQPQPIYDALAQSEGRGGVEPMAPSPEAPAAPHAEFGAPSPAQEAPKGFEELAESIVEEKWHAVSGELGKVNEWKDSVTGRMDKMEQTVTDMKSDLDNLHKAIVSKISEYDKNLLDVGTEIKAMEKVFQKVLPELTGSVAELSRITKTAKGRPAAVKPAKPVKRR